MEPLTSNETKQSQSSLIWSNISVLSPKKKQHIIDKDSRKLLNNVSGIARSGEILAIMGASGVGKTTLMRVLSGRLSSKLHTQGKVYLNGQQTTQIERAHSGFIGHVEQQELFVETMTLEEHLIFQAMLRMPDEVPDVERIERVNSIISQLILIKSKTTMIGRLSGGEKKRLAFATALLTNPHVLLVDEPTSGLDTYLAKSLMNIIRSMAIKRNQTIVVILHQPTNTMFDLIDKICLIVEEGRQAFYGNKDQALDFFANQCQLESSSLDGFIEQLAAPPDMIGNEDINAQQIAANEYEKSEQAKSVEIDIKEHIESTGKNDFKNKLQKIQRGAFLRQLKWLLWRSVAGGRRNPKRTTKLVVRLFVMAIILGVTFFHLRSNPEDYIEKVNSLLLVSFMALLESNMNLMLVEIPTERALVTWEYRRQLYSVGAYYLSRLIVDTGYNIITSTVYMFVILILAGLPHWFLIICVMILVLMTSCAFAAFIGAISSTARTALLTLQPTQNIFANLTGFFINLKTIPAILNWIKYLSYFYYGYRLLLLVQWYNVELHVSCKYFGYNITIPESNICPANGNNVLKCFDVSYETYYFDIMALLIMFFGYHIATYFIILYRTKYDR